MIADAARDLHATVAITTGVGFGFVDQVWGFGAVPEHGIPGVTILVEVKSNRKKKLDPEQIKFRETWRGGPVVKVATVQDVIDVLTGPMVRRLLREQAVRAGYLADNGKPFRPVAVPASEGATTAESTAGKGA